MNNVSVLLVEDEPIIQKEIRDRIDRHEALSLYGIASNMQQARMMLFDDYQLLVTDKQLPDGCGIDLIKELNTRDHNKRTMMMTVFEDEQSVFDAIDAGADGYFVKQDPNLIDAMCSLASFGNPISPSVGQHFINRLRKTVERDVTLTEREKATLQALADGLKYHQIAQRLNVSKHTVPDYIKSLYRKLSVHDRSSAVYVGMKKGLIKMADG